MFPDDGAIEGCIKRRITCLKPYHINRIDNWCCVTFVYVFEVLDLLGCCEAWVGSE